jgi:glycerol-3-phosphate acyltransferase PlsY
MVTIIIACFLAYLCGSISSAIIVCKIMKLPDPRVEGSQNPGATNVLRIGGKFAAAITLIGDVLKGFIPVFIATYCGLSNLEIALVAFFAFIGHLYPIFFQFKGGKGVATALGCLFALNIAAALCWLGTWLLTALLFRYASLSSLIASFFAPFFIWYFTHDEAFTVIIATMLLLLIFRHFTNIISLISGKERKIGQ